MNRVREAIGAAALASATIACDPSHALSQGRERPDSVKLAPSSTLVVHISDPPREAHGAGIIIGESVTSLFIVTARHVLEMLDSPATVKVAFYPDTAAKVIGIVDTRSYKDTNGTIYDIALIAVSKADARALSTRNAGATAPKSVRDSMQFDPDKLNFRRRTQTRHLRSGDRVYSVGCPQGICWGVPYDEVLLYVDGNITFVTQFVRPGNSGGALLTEWGEVAGMVLESAPPFGRALSTESLVKKLEAWTTVSLSIPSVPPWPYDLEITAAALSNGGNPFSRFPSGRATVQGRMPNYFAWHAGVLRLAHENLTLTAGVGGFSLRVLQLGQRAKLTFFGEAGIGRSDSRRDVGGYFIGTPGSTTYEHAWVQTSGGGFGGGLGASLSVIVYRLFSVEVLAGRWEFQLPVEVRPPHEPFFGFGLRWAIL